MPWIGPKRPTQALATMPRYFFALESPTHNIADEEGEELPDDTAAHEAARQTAWEMRGGRHNGGRIVVRTSDGRIVTEVPIDAAKPN